VRGLVRWIAAEHEIEIISGKVARWRANTSTNKKGEQIVDDSRFPIDDT
jgi:hypothetical protein